MISLHQNELKERVQLRAALKAMLEAYAPLASQTASREGEFKLHSAVRMALRALGHARKIPRLPWEFVVSDVGSSCS